MPEPILRRSRRNAAKRVTSATEDVPVQHATKKQIENSTIDRTESETEPIEPLVEGDILPETLPEVQTHSSQQTTIQALIESAEKGIVLFAYSRASTPGCTTQACSFRDNVDEFKTAGYTVYGLSGDKPVANERFKQKQGLNDITLLCDPMYELHKALGIKKLPKGTIRSTIVIQKTSSGGIVLRKTPSSPTDSVKIAKAAILDSE